MLKRLMTQIERKLEEKGEGGAGKVNTFRWLILLGCGGAALMILSSFFPLVQKYQLWIHQREKRKQWHQNGGKVIHKGLRSKRKCMNRSYPMF